MALPALVVEESVADRLVALLARMMKELKIGPAYEKGSQLGPVINAEHRQSIVNWIQKGVDEGAKLVLDGRNVTVKGHEKGFFIGPSLFDGVDVQLGDDPKDVFVYEARKHGHASWVYDVAARRMHRPSLGRPS